MSSSALKLLAASGATADPVYVDDVFSTFLYAGTGSSLNIVTGLDLSGEGGLVWTKSRTSSVSNQLTDTVSGYRVESDDSAAGEASQGNVTFNSNGHTQASGSSFFNDSGNSFVNWSFRKAPGFFDVVTYTGNGVAGRTLAHNLGSVPGMVIVKSLTQGENWEVFHRSTGATKFLILNDSDAASTYAMWNNTAPTSSVFTVSAENAVNKSGESYVAYLFAHDAQDFGTDEDEAIIKCGSYTGNGSATAGPIIDLGFEPQFILMKYVESANWYIYDSMRGINALNINEVGLNPNTAGTGFNHNALKLNASGFQITTDNGNYNGNGETFIYMAIRRPHKPASEFAATDLFKVAPTTNTEPRYVAGFPVDMNITKRHDDASGPYIWVRNFQGRRSQTSSGSDFSATDGAATFDYNNGTTHPDYVAVDSDRQGFMWRRAPEFFDIVRYKGTGSARTVTHNLGVAPEMMWMRQCDGANDWAVYYGDNTDFLLLNQTSATGDDVAYWNDTSPTSSVFTVGDYAYVNTNNKVYAAFLFASADGISKIGTYTGTGNDLNVDCGFSAGARFILIKRVDSTSGWYIWDSVRGIVAGNDPYFLLNSGAVDVTNTDYIDPLASGFTVTSSAPADINNNGGTYLFYAIA